MSDSRTPSARPGQASLWTMTVPAGAAPLTEAKVDLRVSREQIQRALDAMKERTRAFACTVSQDVLWTSVGRRGDTNRPSE